MKPFNVLLVDDFADLRSLLKYTLESEFPYVAVIEAENGKDAINKLNADCRLVLSDWKMPKMSGLELLKWVRSSPLYSNIPFIMVTSACDEDSMLSAKEAGTSAYLVKPWSEEVLFAAVAQFIGHLDRRAFCPVGDAELFDQPAIVENAIATNAYCGEFSSEKRVSLPALFETMVAAASLTKGDASKKGRRSVRRPGKSEAGNSQLAFQFDRRH